MPANNLAAALLGSGNEGAGILGIDPGLMAASGDLALAQAMMKNSISTAPVGHWTQALAQMAQGGAGQFIQHQTISDLGKTLAGTASDVSASLPADHFLQPGLHSKNPAVLALAIGAAPKAYTLGSEYKDLGPGGQLKSAAPAGQPPTESTAPQTPTGKAFWDAARTANPLARAYLNSAGIKDATEGGVVFGPGTGGVPLATAIPGYAPAVAKVSGAKATAEAAGKSDFEPGGDAVIQTPTGPQTIPITAATRAAMQPPGLAASVGTRAPMPPTLQPATPTAGDKPGTAGAQPGQPGPALPPGSGQPAGGVGGKPLANPAIEPFAAKDAAELEKDRESALKGQGDMATIKMIQDFLPTVQTGWSAESKLEAARILKTMGTSDAKIQDILKTDVASGQILQKKFLELSAAAARSMGAREPGSVISMFQKTYPNLGTDEQAVRLQTNALYMDRLRAQALAQDKTNYLNESVNGVQGTGRYRGLQGFNEQFNQAHPPEAYLSAAESMSGVPHAWQRVKDPAQRQAIINLIPRGSTYMAPDNTMRIRPTGGAQPATPGGQ